MPTAQDVAWFKSQFEPLIAPALAGTPFTVDMVTAIACQETGGIWPVLRRKGLSTPRILELCVGDTIDASITGGGRRAFPKNKVELLAAPDGARMFEIARQGLVDMAGFIAGYGGAAAKADKFCHGFGIFQLDLQFFRTDPAYFLERRYADFGHALGRCIGELRAALKRIGWQAKTALTDSEMAGVAIAYNTGRYYPAKGLKQGYFDGVKFYGENFFAFLQLAHGVAGPASVPIAASRGARLETPVCAPVEMQVAIRVEGEPIPPESSRSRKRAAKKGTARNVTAKKVVAKKGAAKRGVAKRGVAKRGVAKRGVAKRVPAKALAKKAPAKKAPAKAPARKAGRKAAPGTSNPPSPRRPRPRPTST